jgi:hypothetical protein
MLHTKTSENSIQLYGESIKIMSVSWKEELGNYTYISAEDMPKK